MIQQTMLIKQTWAALYPYISSNTSLIPGGVQSPSDRQVNRSLALVKNHKVCHISIYEMEKSINKDRNGFFKVNMLLIVGLVLNVGLVRPSSSDSIT